MSGIYHGRRKRPADLDERRGGHDAKAARNAAIVADYLAGVGAPTLAKRYGISQQRAYIILGNAGIAIRPQKAKR